MKPEVAGRLTARLRVTGSAGDPKVVLTISGHDLNVRRSASAAEGPSAIDLGHASIHLTYEDRAAHADVDFASAHGGELRVDAAARVDLAYPAVTEGIDAKKIPVHGKVVAKDFDVAWIARFNDRSKRSAARSAPTPRWRGPSAIRSSSATFAGRTARWSPSPRPSRCATLGRSAGRRCRSLARMADRLEDRIEVQVEVAHRLVAG